MHTTDKKSQAMKEAEVQSPMSFLRDFVDGLKKSGLSQTELSKKSGVSQSVISRLKNEDCSTRLDNVARLADVLGARISFPSDKTEVSREVCWVNPRTVCSGEGLTPPEHEDYFAVPLVEEAGAGPGVIPQGELISWFLVWRHQESIRHRSDLIAVRIAKNADSMQPTLGPGDIVLVDRQDRDASSPGRIMLVLDPVDGSGKIKRVSVRHIPKERDYRITFYSDNAAAYEPEVYSLRDDFDGAWERAVVGRVIWAWSDISHK